MSGYHFRLAKECNVDSEERRFNYFGIEIDCSEVLFRDESVWRSY
jgi:hypothetical protein